MENTGIQALSFLIGTWQTSGTVTGENITIKGTDSYQWVLGNIFILHTADVMMGDNHTEVIELIGYDEDEKQYFFRSFDNAGSFTTMPGELKEGGNLVVTGGNIRSTLKVIEPGKQMAAFWERKDGGNNWQPWMDMKFNK
ncbi:MAG: DUF1579 domain-containing protein [Sphingobacteriaceae bacterium]|nr:MAG: DUF1579 domain-containing protein [Sphingobacteriaceae bacterium]